MNVSELFQIVGEQYPVLTKYPFWVVAILAIAAIIIIMISEVAKKAAVDIYDKSKEVLKATNISREPASPPIEIEPTKPLQLTFALSQRNPNFTGREDILAELRAALTSGLVAGWKQVLTGLGGTGKSQIAVEYAYRHKEEYKFIWWLQSEEPAALASNYAGLAKELYLPEKSCADQTAIIVAVKRWLGDNSNWLLIFDNAKSSDDIEQYFPREGTGHIIITSRNPNWGHLAGVLPIQVFKRSESVDFLIKRTKKGNQESADKLADALGDLPLALEQAGAYIEETATSFADYLKLFLEQRSKILKRGKSTAYPETIATTWDISFQAIKKDFPEAIDLLKLFAFLAPDNIPRSL